MLSIRERIALKSHTINQEQFEIDQQGGAELVSFSKSRKVDVAVKEESNIYFPLIVSLEKCARRVVKLLFDFIVKKG